MGRDHPGRVRLYGREVTKTLLKQKAGSLGHSSTSADDEMVKKSLEELEERMKQRMQEKINEKEQRMQENFNAQKATIERDVTMNIITQLQRLNPGVTLDPDMLRSSVRLSGVQNE